MVYIYILELENKKYYIGKTSNPNFRLKQHFNSFGSYWTRKYKPLKIIKTIPDCDDFDEDKYTIKYMSTYGLQNVRGGTFCQLVLSKENINIINKMINGSTNKCFICGESTHFVKDCNKKSNCSFITNVNDQDDLDNDEDYLDNDEDDLDDDENDISDIDENDISDLDDENDLDDVSDIDENDISDIDENDISDISDSDN